MSIGPNGGVRLRTQIALLLALGLLVAQAINLGLFLEQRRSGGRDAAADVAAARIADRAAGGETRPGRAARLARRADEASARGARWPSLERAVRARLTGDYGVDVAAVRAVERRAPHGGRRSLLVSTRLENGRRVTVRLRGPPPIGPVVARLLGQTLVIYLALLLPLLWLVSRAIRPLERLTAGAREWRPGGPTDAQPLAGPADVRALIAAFEEMRARIERLLTEKDVMLGAIGHDLRTPLTALRVQVESIADEDVRAAMIGSIDRLSNDLESILALARSARALPRRESVDLTGLIASLADERRRAGEDVSVAGNGVEAVILGDPSALRRAIANSVDNAVRYGDRARLSIEARGNRVLLSVCDDGPGLGEAELARAGEPFVRFEASRNRESGGHGLGLAIARAIVERHGGTLTLANARPHGLAVTIDLPAAS